MHFNKSMYSKLFTDEIRGVAMHDKVISKTGENQIKEVTRDMSQRGDMLAHAEGIKSSKELTTNRTYIVIDINIKITKNQEFSSARREYFKVVGKVREKLWTAHWRWSVNNCNFDDHGIYCQGYG